MILHDNTKKIEKEVFIHKENENKIEKKQKIFRISLQLDLVYSQLFPKN